MENMMGIVQAAMSGLMVHIRPMVAGKIRAVLERNESIVYQTPAALDHLTQELLDAVFPEHGFPS